MRTSISFSLGSKRGSASVTSVHNYAIAIQKARDFRKENGAAEKTRTSTGVSPQRPQRCASTNSATAARLRCPLYVTFMLNYQACFAGDR